MKARIIFLIPFILLLCGCQDYREINQNSIVAGFAVDIGRDGNTHVTVEMVDFSDSQNGGGGKSQKISVEGKSLTDAISHGLSESSEYLYWNHAVTVIVSPEYARRGIGELLDYIYRNSGITLSTNILVSDLGSAKEVLELDTNNSAIKSYAIRNIIDDSKFFEGITECTTYEVINDIAESGIEPVLGVVTEGEHTENKSIDVEGAAIFKDDKLIGFVDSEDTAYLRILRDDLQSGYFDFTVNGSNISCLIKNGSTEYKPTLEDDRLTMNVKFSAEYEIISQNGSINISDENVLKEITKLIGAEMEKRINDTASRIQSEFGVDAFGFGAAVKRKKPEIYRTLNKNEYFKNMEINVTADIKEPHDADQYPAIDDLIEVSE